MRRLVLALFTAFALLSGLTVSAGAQDVDCPQLSYEEAQDILAQDPSDPNGLDRDNDGIACETNAGGGGGDDGAADDGGDDGAADDGSDDSAADDGSDDGETSELPNTGAGMTSTGSDSMLLVTALSGVAALLGFAALRVHDQS